MTEPIPRCKLGLPLDDVIHARASVATLGDTGEAYGLVADGAIAIKGGRIAWVGPGGDVPAEHRRLPVRDLGGRLVTPGLIDCHTHIVHGGDRAREFELRLQGATYEEIARAGGGIVSTVGMTRAASEERLLSDALKRVDHLIGEGVTAIEVKSGYGLDVATELKMLKVARRIGAERPIRVRTSFLGAHAVPADYKGRSGAYIDEVCIPALRAAHAQGLVDAVDGFCEGIAFSVPEIERLFNVARELGLPVKLHAEQLSNLGGAKLAARFGALSADHLEWLDEAGVAALAQAGTVAVLLPGAFYTLRETRLPPVALLRQHKVRIAIATDCNPGSSPLTSLLIAMNMAATLFRLTPEETLRGATVHAAHALGLKDCGRIAPGARADLAIWDASHPAELAYRIGFNPLFERVFAGSP